MHFTIEILFGSLNFVCVPPILQIMSFDILRILRKIKNLSVYLLILYRIKVFRWRKYEAKEQANPLVFFPVGSGSNGDWLDGQCMFTTRGTDKQYNHWRDAHCFVTIPPSRKSTEWHRQTALRSAIAGE